MSSKAAGDDRGKDEQCPQVSDEDRDSLVLDLMLTERSGYPWSRDEIARTIGDHIGAFDAVARLEEDGFVHRMGEFVFPTRTCRRADQLKGNGCF